MSKPTVTQVIKSVLAAFIGVQSEANRKRFRKRVAFSLCYCRVDFYSVVCCYNYFSCFYYRIIEVGGFPVEIKRVM